MNLVFIIFRNLIKFDYNFCFWLLTTFFIIILLLFTFFLVTNMFFFGRFLYLWITRDIKLTYFPGQSSVQSSFLIDNVFFQASIPCNRYEPVCKVFQQKDHRSRVFNTKNHQLPVTQMSVAQRDLNRWKISKRLMIYTQQLHRRQHCPSRTHSSRCQVVWLLRIILRYMKSKAHLLHRHRCPCRRQTVWTFAMVSSIWSQRSTKDRRYQPKWTESKGSSLTISIRLITFHGRFLN